MGVVTKDDLARKGLADLDHVCADEAISRGLEPAVGRDGEELEGFRDEEGM